MEALLEVGQRILDCLHRMDVLALEGLLLERRRLLEGLDLSGATPDQREILRHQDEQILDGADYTRQICLDDLLRSLRRPALGSMAPARPRLLDERH